MLVGVSIVPFWVPPHSDDVDWNGQQHLNKRRRGRWLTDEERRRPEERLDLNDLYMEETMDEDIEKQQTPSWYTNLTTIGTTLNRQSLQVFVVPFTHLSTAGMYRYDANFQHRVMGILSTVVSSLLQDPRRTFVWSEMAYFAWWWHDQEATTQQSVRRLLQSRQLELVTGGWVNVVVGPDQSDTIDTLYTLEMNLREGHDWIRTHLGAEFVPHTAWLMDSYDTSPTVALLLAQHNFTAMVLQQHDVAPRVVQELRRRRHLEFFWRPPPPPSVAQHQSTGKIITTDRFNGQYRQSNDIFTHVLPSNGYDARSTCGPDAHVCCLFDFAQSVAGAYRTDARCSDDQVPDPMDAANLPQRAQLLVDQYRKRATLFRSNALLIPLGDDFRFQSPKEAKAQFDNYQLLFDYINANVTAGMRIQFGTPSEYARCARKSFRGPVPFLQGHLYSSRARPHDKALLASLRYDIPLVVHLERALVAAESMNVPRIDLQRPRRALQLRRHHQGIAGTNASDDPVVQDYVDRMWEAIAHVRRLMRQNGMSTKSVYNCSDSAVVSYNPFTAELVRQQSTVSRDKLAGWSRPQKQSFTNFTKTTVSTLDPATGMFVKPFREAWIIRKVESGEERSATNRDVQVSQDGIVESETFWNRTRFEMATFGDATTAIDIVYEAAIPRSNETWIVRLSSDLANVRFCHVDQNGFTFAKLFTNMAPSKNDPPAPRLATLSSIEDGQMRFSVWIDQPRHVSCHSDGSIDIFLAHPPPSSFSYNKNPWPSRVQLRIVIERGQFGAKSGREFNPTPQYQRTWDAMRYPLELFHTNDECDDNFPSVQFASEAKKHFEATFEYMQTKLHKILAPAVTRNITANHYSSQKIIVPFVFMVYRRVDYLKVAMESLLRSDFPREKVPIIISHDGHVPEVMAYVDSLRRYFQVVQLFHPHACYDHPDTFPGNDPNLNVGYAGDAFGNPRNFIFTCCKHHFTWLLNVVFTDTTFVAGNVDTFLFLEEDYIVAPSVYRAIAMGLNAMDQFEAATKGGFLGIALEPTKHLVQLTSDDWFVEAFRTGPMTLHRLTYQKLQENAAIYCGLDGFDEYNWDWSLVHVQNAVSFPHTVLVPAIPLAKHIGFTGGMHNHTEQRVDPLTSFCGTRIMGTLTVNPRQIGINGNGGWGHPADQSHCMSLLVKNG
jgi:Glycosyl hydrolases family 38 N-terminal domain/N-acetylglucosaminyltransferase II (MGAT2)